MRVHLDLKQVDPKQVLDMMLSWSTVILAGLALASIIYHTAREWFGDEDKRR